jgi:aspartate aminotransferase-like enzyme
MVERSDLPRYYFDFRKERKSLQDNQTAYTPAVSLILGLRESLSMMMEEGLENVFRRHARLAEATRAAVRAMGLRLFAPESPSNALTAVLAPEGMDAQKVVKLMREKYGFTIAGGQSQAKGKIFRIAHLGYYDDFDVIKVIGALERVLAELGWDVEPGQGVRAAQEVLGGTG